MSTEVKNPSLGNYIHERRLAQGLDIETAAVRSQLHPSYWRKLEAGQYHAPKPHHLRIIAEVLRVPVEDLYGLAGYSVPERLPTFRPYLRAKYQQLPPEAVADLERYFDLLRSHYGIPKDQPVFPPKPNDEPAPPGKTDQPKRPSRRAS